MPDYAERESPTTMPKYGSQRNFKNGSTHRVIERHFTLGNGSREECIQVYFDPDPKTGRAVIGYIGRHLEYSGQRT